MMRVSIWTRDELGAEHEATVVSSGKYHPEIAYDLANRAAEALNAARYGDQDDDDTDEPVEYMPADPDTDEQDAK